MSIVVIPVSGEMNNDHGSDIGNLPITDISIEIHMESWEGRQTRNHHLPTQVQSRCHQNQNS